MFAIVILGLSFGMFALIGIAAIAFLDVAFQPTPEEVSLHFASCDEGLNTQTRRIPEMPKRHVA